MRERERQREEWRERKRESQDKIDHLLNTEKDLDTVREAIVTSNTVRHGIQLSRRLQSGRCPDDDHTIH